MTPAAPNRMAAWLESAWLARYLDRQLEGEELAWFEAYLLDKPELLEAVEADNAIRDALIHDGVGDHKDIQPPWRFAAGALRIAAAVLVGVGIGKFAIQDRSVLSPSVIANPPRIVFDTERGLPAKPTVENADEKTAYRLIEVAVPLEASNVRIRLPDGKQYALRVSPDSFVSFLVAMNKDVSKIVLTYDVGGKPVERSIPVDTSVGE